VSIAMFCLTLALVVAAAGLAAGVALFPVGRITTLSGDTLPLATGIGRLILASGLVGLSMLGLAAIGLFVSTLTDVPVGAMAATLAVVVLSGVLDAVPQLSGLHPWLFTHGWLTFADLFHTRVSWGGIGRNLALQAAYVAVFGSAAWARFVTKDVQA
jgi:ABC-2 type transport system permease protein